SEASLKKVITLVLAAMLTLTGASAWAGNAQRDDNKDNTTQSGTGNTGDANAGQITGTVGDGTTSVDATNSTDHSDIESGDARIANTASTFTGLDASTATAANVQRGDNKSNISQDAETASGNVSDGQIIGVVTSSGGSADVVLANTSSFNDVESGRAKSTNDSNTFTGLQALLFDGASSSNIQRGDNKTTVNQTNPTTTGNAMTGQIVGVQSSGVTTVDGTNLSAHNDVNTVAAFGANSVDSFVGLLANATNTGVAANVQRGDNKGTFNQDAPG